MSDSHIQLGLFITQILMIVVQLGAFVGLIWYVVETRRMREAAQAQVTVSSNLLTVAMDQAEGALKPCVTLASSARNPYEAVIGPLGNTEALSLNGFFAVVNIGNGPALNVRYEFIPIGNTVSLFQRQGIRYVQNLLHGQQTQMTEEHVKHNGEFEVVFQYESLGGRQYETKIDMNGYVLTGVRFREIRS